MYTVEGIERVDYTNKANKRVRGVKLHCSYVKENVSGICVDSFYLPEDRYNVTVELGDNVEPLYDKG